MTRPAIPRLLAAAGVALLVAAPWMLGSYEVSLLSYGLTIAVIASSAHLLNHHGGQPSLGQAVFAGAGAYAAAYAATAWSANFAAQLAAAILAGLAVGAAVGVMLARLRAMTFLLATLALGELGTVAAESLGTLGARTAPPVTLVAAAAPVTHDGYLYLYVLACAAMTIAAVAWAASRSLGLRLAAVSAGEQRLSGAGLSSALTMWQAIVFSAAAAGVAGHMLIATRRFIAPADAGFEVSALALVAAIIGGRSLMATCAAALTLVLLRDLVGNDIAGFGPLILAAAFVAVALTRGHLQRRKAGGRDPSEH